MKCDKCQDGYLIAKKSGSDYFLGCTNYKDDKTGCNNAISKKKYFEMMSLTPDKPIEYKTKEEIKKERDHTIVPNEYIIKDKKYNIFGKNLGDLYSVAKIIINCVEQVSQKKYLGRVKIEEILYGNTPKGINKMNIEQIPEFGSLIKTDKDQVSSLFVALISLNYIHKTVGEYPVLHPNDIGKEFVKSTTREQLLKIREVASKIYKPKIKTP